MTPRDIAETMVIERDVPISMDDGLVIRADVYRPKTQYPVPVIMTSGPYGKAGRAVAIGLLAKLPPSSSAAATGAAPAPPQRSLPSIKSKRNRPVPRSKARAGFGPPLGSASRARNREKNG